MRRTRKINVKLICIILILAIIIVSVNVNNNIQNIKKANKNAGITSMTDFYTALQETAYAYYMRGKNIQYNHYKGIKAIYQPEEATEQNTTYIVCSGFTKNVYADLFGLYRIDKTDYSILEETSHLLNWGNTHKAEDGGVIGYSEKSSGTMQMYNGKGEKDGAAIDFSKNYDTAYKEMVKKLQIRRYNNNNWPYNVSI